MLSLFSTGASRLQLRNESFDCDFERLFADDDDDDDDDDAVPADMLVVAVVKLFEDVPAVEADTAATSLVVLTKNLEFIASMLWGAMLLLLLLLEVDKVDA